MPTQQSIKERVKSLIKYFNYSLYSNVCRSIFEKDKLLFSFLLTMSIKMSEGKLGKVQFNLLIENMTGIDNPLKRENPYKWLQNACWNRLCTFASKDPIMFEPVLTSFEKHEE